MTRARSRRMAAAATAVSTVTMDLPEEILAWEIFVRLPAKDVLRCRAVCRSWRGLTYTADFLLAHHRRQPSLPLLTLCGSTNGRLPMFQGGRPVLTFDDFQGFELHASCDGLLLLALSGDRFAICNPATHQCALLPGLSDDRRDGHIGIQAMYLHRPSGEYRILYMKRRYKQPHPDAAHYILALRLGLGGSSRRIGITSDSPDMEKNIIQAWHRANMVSPVVFRSCLHWDPGFRRNDTGIIVFDTEAESFRFMRRPAAATSFCTRLCNMEGSVCFSCFNACETVAQIWVLEDYEREIWAFKYQVKFPVENLCNLQDRQHLVLSAEGDMLVYSNTELYMFQCDNTGNSVTEFRFGSLGSSIISGHWFKESLVNHDFFPRRGDALLAGQPDLFRML